MTVLITDRGAMTGRPDNTDFIQEAIDKLPPNETLRVPAGVFRIKATRCNQFRWGIRLKSNMCLQLDKGAELWAIGTKYVDTNMIWMQEASNVKITGEGMVRGERNVHQGQGGEHGHCIRITYGCKNIALENFTARDAWGDGIMIDDEVAICEAMRSLLESWGHAVIIANSGAEMLERIVDCASRPRLIICDYRLQEENGIAVIKRLQSEFNDEIPAMLITGDTAPDRLLEARSSGFLLLHKPVSADKLQLAIEAVTAAPEVEML